MLSFILIAISSLFFPGIIAVTKSKLSGRKGPRVSQPLKDIIRLFKKGSVFSESSSFILQVAPTIYLTTVLCAIFLMPFNHQKGFISFQGDFLFFIYLLALGKFFLVLSSLDTASSFSGMGANREALYSLLVEPALFFILGAFVLLTGQNSFFAIYEHTHFVSYAAFMLALLTAFILAQIVMVENSRMPVDDPKTHLELTMIHEVMVLDISGFDLGLVQLASSLKFSIYGALIANFFMPKGWALGAKIIFFFFMQILLAFSIGVAESFIVRNRLNRNPQYILTLSSISLLIFFSILILIQNHL